MMLIKRHLLAKLLSFDVGSSHTNYYLYTETQTLRNVSYYRVCCYGDIDRKLKVRRQCEDEMGVCMFVCVSQRNGGEQKQALLRVTLTLIACTHTWSASLNLCNYYTPPDRS